MYFMISVMIILPIPLALILPEHSDVDDLVEAASIADNAPHGIVRSTTLAPQHDRMK